MNKEKAIRSFLAHVEQLRRLPLITGSEMTDLFGEEVTGALAELDYHNQKERVCLDCKNRCCQTIDCEFYAQQFSRCPIHDFRPVLCRLHFCHRFHISGNSLIEELGNIFLDSLLAVERYNARIARMFDNPPLARVPWSRNSDRCLGKWGSRK